MRKREEGLGGDGGRHIPGAVAETLIPALSHPCQARTVSTVNHHALVRRRPSLSCWGRVSGREGPAGAQVGVGFAVIPTALAPRAAAPAGRFPVSSPWAFGFFRGQPVLPQPPPFPPLAAAPSGRREGRVPGMAAGPRGGRCW